MFIAKPQIYRKEICSLKKSIYISSVIGQKGESQNGGNEKTKHAKFSEKRILLTPWYAHVKKLNIYPLGRVKKPAKNYGLKNVKQRKYKLIYININQ